MGVNGSVRMTRKQRFRRKNRPRDDPGSEMQEGASADVKRVKDEIWDTETTPDQHIPCAQAAELLRCLR